MTYSIEDKERIFNEIIRLISIEGFSVRRCLREEGMPSRETFFKWLREEEEKEGVKPMADQYARACKDRADLIFEDIMSISDATADDIILDKDGNEIVNHNVIQRDRLRVDSRKWMLGKMNPKKYNDKYIHVIEGGEEPIKHALFNMDLIKKNVQTDDGTI